VNTDKLETLSLEELYALADKSGLDLPAGLERPFVVEEILEALEDDSEDRRSSQGGALHMDEKKYSDLRIDEIDVDPGVDEFIPTRYNETVIRAIVRDPSWAFAYWDVADSDIDSWQEEESSSELFLRVAELGNGNGEAMNDPKHECFDIPVALNDLQWYINLPRSGVRFRIDLCVRRSGQSGRFRVLARSNEVLSPKQSLSLSPEGMDERSYKLLALSGLEDVPMEDLPEDSPLRLFQSGLGISTDSAD
jgi:hypothetical protein